MANLGIDATCVYQMDLSINTLINRSCKVGVEGSCCSGKNGCSWCLHMIGGEAYSIPLGPSSAFEVTEAIEGQR